MKTTTGGKLLAVVIAVTLLAGTAYAHHSFAAEYDRSKAVKLVGKVTLVKFANPHAWIYIDVDTNGKKVNWALETGSGNALIRRGWRKEDLKVGTVLEVDGWQARNGSPTANVNTITLEINGKKQRLFAGDGEAPK
jgi:hypothetical protein